MFRRLILAVLALAAFLALESCGVSRLAGPSAISGKNDPVGQTGAGGDRTDDGGGEQGGNPAHPTVGRTGGPDRSN